MLLKHFSTLILTLCTAVVFAQSGTISGKLFDAKSTDVIIGATVRLDGGAQGAVSDFDGNFTVRNVPAGTHKIQISFLGYQTKAIDQIVVNAGQDSYISIALEEESVGQNLKEVVIVADVRKETQTALTMLQKNAPMIADGISAQTIRLTPDRTTGDVIKRISGASIQDNKFAVIRGLADRYNLAMLNGSLLTSTEPDRRAFSLDMFPSAMLDNLVVMKTASADMPGEWAGGAIMISTRDIPAKNFFNLSFSGGYNTLATFKEGLDAQGGKRDWLGFDDGSRNLPTAMPSRMDYVNLPLEERLAISRNFKNNWALNQTSSVAPNLGTQMSAGFVKKVGEEGEWGTTIATTYSNNNSLQQGERNDFDISGQLFGFTESQAQNNISLGVLANTAYKFNARHKIGIQALHSTNTTETIATREGSNFETEQYIRSNTVEFIENHVLTTRLSGDHQLGKYKLNWSGGYNKMDRSTPNTRRAFASKNFEAEEDEPFRIDLPPGSATRDRGAIFYSELDEDVYNGQADFSMPYKAWGQKHNLKIGTLYQGKSRGFAARNLGYIRAKSSKFDFNIVNNSTFATVFDTSNIKESGFVVDEITNLFDAYTGSSDLTAGYILMENVLAPRVRVSYGVRMERFNQKLDSYDQTAQPVNVDQTYVDWLPSLNAKYEVNEKTNLRLSLSKTTSRPEFREIAPFPFYDYFLQATVIGNPALVRTQIYNADLRWEIFPGGNQLITASLFYKHFNNPIEYTLSSLGAGSNNRSYQNIETARSYGIEFEGRKNLAFLLGDAGANWTAFANVALIQSRIDVSNLNTADAKRPLQGQSPYVVNTGVSYGNVEWGLNTMLILNVVGDRLSQVGTSIYPDIYERHRPVLDFSVVKDFGRTQLKFTASDLLRRDLVMYQDNNQSHKYEADKDSVFQRGNRGSTVSLTAILKI
jgi:TonB-dependent receptor